jgi:hypothetical protein
MKTVQSYKLSETEFTEVSGGLENLQDLFKWSGFFFSQGEGFKGKKLYYVIHIFLDNENMQPHCYLVTKELIDEVREISKHKEPEMINELMLTTLIDHGILKLG